MYRQFRSLPDYPGNRGRARLALLLVLLPVLSVCPGSHVAAEARREGGDDAMRKLQYMLRELTTENQALKADNARLQAETRALGSEKEKLDAELDAKRGALTRNRQRNDMLVERVKSDSDKYHALAERYRETLKALRTTQFKAAYLEQAVTERNEWIDTCKANNDDLYQANAELLKRYQNQGVLDALGAAEPVTGLARVRRESVVEDYRYRLEDLKMLDFSGSSPRSPDGVASADMQP